MINGDYPIRIFDPVFTYDRASNQIGLWKELKSFLALSTTLTERTLDISDRPFASAFYQYFPNIALLMRKDNTYYCQTFKNGKRDRVYEVVREAEELKEFFSQCGSKLTVLENERGFEFPPDFEIVLSFAQCFENVRQKSEKHKKTIDFYSKQLNKLEYEFDDPKGIPLNDTYKNGLLIAKRFLNYLDAIATKTCHEDFAEARKYPLEDNYGHCRMFGLYIYALQFGINRGRFLSKRGRAICSVFNEMLKEMHLFMETYPNIEEEYCKFFNLQANERARLNNLLETEGFHNKFWGYIGDDIFC